MNYERIAARDELIEAIEQLIEAKMNDRAADPEWKSGQEVLGAGDRLAAALDAVLELKPR